MQLKTISFLAIGLLTMWPLPATAQWIKVPPLKTPRTVTGEVDLKAPTPRRADGKPDLTGLWSTDDIRYLRDISRDMKPEDFPFQPWSNEAVR